MDAAGKLKGMKNEKGIALVYVALTLVILVAFIGIVVDIGYMYVAKGQLQNAADAAALAGAARLNGGTDITAFGNYSGARREAWRLACKNTAARSNVFLVASAPDCTLPPADLNIGNSPAGDIVLGNWDATRTPPFLPDPDGTALPPGAAINAVKAVARRTTGSPGGQVDVFFAKVLAAVGLTKWDKMSAKAEAIATRPPLPVLPIPVCLPRCDEVTNYTVTCPGKKFLLNAPVYEAQCGIAWSDPVPPFNRQPTPAILRDYLQNPQFINLCNQCIRTKQGGAATILDDLQAAFDKNKTSLPVPGIGNVVGWKVLIPVLQPANSPCGTVGPQPCPGDQPDPYLVISMAVVILTNVDRPPADDCLTCSTNERGFGITFLGTVANSPTSTRIGCFSCADPGFPPLSQTQMLVK